MDITKTKCFDAMFSDDKSEHLIFYRDYAVFEIPIDAEKREVMYQYDIERLKETLVNHKYMERCTQSKKHEINRFCLACLSLASQTRSGCSLYLDEETDQLVFRISNKCVDFTKGDGEAFFRLVHMAVIVHIRPNKRDSSEVVLEGSLSPLQNGDDE